MGAEKVEKAEKAEKATKVDKKVEELIKSIEGMTVLELSDLVKALEEKFGVQAAMPTMAAVPQAGGAQAQTAGGEEKTSFNVVLASVGGNKIAVIKEVRAMTNLGLKDAKDLVDSAPKTIKEGVTKEEAEQMKKKIEAAGGTVELK